MIIGGDAFTPNEGYETAGSILTIFTTLFVMIVMMNLLISIIGDIFSKVQDNQLNEYYQEKATIIAQNSYLIPDSIKDERSTKFGELLLICSKAGYDL